MNVTGSVPLNKMRPTIKNIVNIAKNPICSYGIIAYTNIKTVRKYLMIRRKHTIGYGVIVRGKYDEAFKDTQLNDAIDRMTISEKQRILTSTFEDNWENLWNRPFIHGHPYPIEQQSAYNKYLENIEYVKQKIHDSLTNWEDPEWEFPKGRLNVGEKAVHGAVREFSEETSIPTNDIVLISNISPFEEYYTSFDNKTYKNTYFLATLYNNMYDLNNFQLDEVSKMEWMTEVECINNIRPYHLEKKMIIRTIENILNEYMVVNYEIG
jgi:hypothetical protein